MAARTLVNLRDAYSELVGEDHVIHPCDVSDPAQARELIDRTIRELGRIDVLVNAAGVAPVKPIESTTPEITRAALALNTEAPANLIHFAWPTLLLQRDGVIVNISSMATFNPFNGFFAYAASKAALNMLSFVTNAEGSPHEVHCYVICPGAVETPMLRSIVSPAALPTAQTLSPDDVANVVMQCVRRERTADAGRPILLPSPTQPAN